MVIDARQQFGEKFIKDNLDKSYEETNERLRVMGPAFINMVSRAIKVVNKENRDA